MYYAGVDYPKHYSIVSIQNAQGSIVREQRVDHAGQSLQGPTDRRGRDQDRSGRPDPLQHAGDLPRVSPSFML